MYRRILLAYDGCNYSAAALRQSAELARVCKAELHLLGIVVTTGSMALAEGAAAVDIWGMERESLQRALDAAVLYLGEREVNVVTSIREGDSEAEIIEHAHHIGADLIVLGHSAKGIISRLFHSSVGAHLLKSLPCSLLVATDKA